MSDHSITIGALARLTKTNPAVIREYEALGLLPTPARPRKDQAKNAVGSRIYDDSDVRRLTFLRRCRDLGVFNARLSLLTTLIDRPTEANQETLDFAQTLLSNVRDHIKELAGLEKTLDALLQGVGETALAIDNLPSAENFTEKRLRRLLRKPLSTPANR